MKEKQNKAIYDEIAGLNIDEELTLEDIKGINSFLKSQPVAEPPQDLPEKIMYALEHTYDQVDDMDEDADKQTTNNTVWTLINHIKYQMSLFDKTFWAVSTAVICLGLLFIVSNHMAEIAFLAPFMISFSIYYCYRGVYYKTNEMEGACKYSYYEITLARTIIIIVYNILLVGIIGTANWIISGTVILGYLLLTWLAPLLMVYYISLRLLYAVGMVSSWVASICIWMGYLMLYNKFRLSTSIIYYNSVWLNINAVILIVSAVLLFVFLGSMKNNEKHLSS